MIVGAIPVGTVLGGVLAEVLGLRAALLASGAGLLLGSVPYVLLKVVTIRLEHVPAAAEATAASKDRQARIRP